MKNNRILRSPDVSVNTVTLKSDYIANNISKSIEEGVVSENVDILNNISENTQDDIFNETTKLDEVDLQALSECLKEKELKLNSEKKDLESSYVQLEEKKNNYQQEIYNDLKNELTKEIKTEYEEKIRHINKLINGISERENVRINGVEDEIISIVYESVCKIIGAQMRKSDSVISVVREVMKFTQDRMEMVLRVSIKDFEILERAREELSAGVSNRIEIVADDHVRYGGCILETAAGRIDGRLEQQLSSLLQILINERD